MKIEIVRIAERGIPNRERLHLKVLVDTRLEIFFVLDTMRESPSTISNIARHTYWFTPKPVKAGDNIILYTRKGEPSETKNPDGSTNHFLFWGLDQTIWNKPNDCAVLFEIFSWITSPNEPTLV